MKALKSILLVGTFSIAMGSFSQTNVIYNTGDVGIGTLTPGAKLDVNGRMMVDSLAIFKDSVRIQKKLIVDQDVKIKGKSVFVDNGKFKANLTTFGVGKFKDKLVIDGLTKMKGNAIVEGNLKLPNLTTSNNPVSFLTTNANGKITSLDKSGLINAIYQPIETCFVDQSGNIFSVWKQNSSPNFGALYTGVDCPARVGIGTDSPLATLDVRGNSYTSGFMGIGEVPNSAYLLNIKSSFKTAGIHLVNNIPANFPITTPRYGIQNIVSNNDIIAYSVTNTLTNSDVFVVKGDGKVGVGTSNPEAMLEVFTTDKTGLIVETAHNGNFGYGIQSRVLQDKTKAFAVYNKAGGNNEESFVVFGNGNVFATKILVRTTPFPDYVFKKDYELMPLLELETYIKENKHLPNMPTAQKVEKEGADLGEINRVLVEKVEELTLYMIEQDKRIKQLEDKQ